MVINIGIKMDYYIEDYDKPAIIEPKGCQSWYKNGVLHQENGQPAVIRQLQFSHYTIKVQERYMNSKQIKY
jgi:hypothetical protein